MREATLNVLNAEDKGGGMDVVSLGELVSIFYCPLLDIKRRKNIRI